MSKHLEQSATSLLDKAEATALTQRIRVAVDGLWDLLLKAHDYKAWKALGYKTWGAYVEGEFSMSRQRSISFSTKAASLPQCARRPASVNRV